MLHFTVDDQNAADAACQKCCCEKLNLKPGTTSKVQIGYAPWAVPIGRLHCAPSFQIEPMETCAVPVASNNLPPAISSNDGMARFDTGKNVALNADLRTKVTDIDGDPITFKILPLYAPKHGKIVLDPAGPFTYTPAQLWTGEERFYASASDGKHEPFIFEVMIAVEIDAGTMVPTPHISIGPAVVDQRLYTVYFPVTMSPAAQPCEMWRLSVLQMALDCNCICFSRTDCFDIGVAQC